MSRLTGTAAAAECTTSIVFPVKEPGQGGSHLDSPVWLAALGSAQNGLISIRKFPLYEIIFPQEGNRLTEQSDDS